jgi:hypothetical protein
MQKTSWTLLLAAALAAGCGGGGDSAEGSFRLIEFLDSGKDSIPRNRDLTFRFSAPVAPGQDLPERLKVQNVQSTQGDSDFSRSIGTYVVSGDEVLFVPRLPQAPDRGDAGFRANGNYHVFLKGGPDALRSTDGDIIARQQEFLFDTNEFFEDPTPGEPPRALRLLARDGSTGAAGDLSRLDPRPLQLAAKTTAELLADSKAVDPGAGGPPGYAIPWVFELEINEPLTSISGSRHSRPWWTTHATGSHSAARSSASTFARSFAARTASPGMARALSTAKSSTSRAASAT